MPGKACGEIIIHPQTSTAVLLKIGNGSIISSHTLLDWSSSSKGVSGGGFFEILNKMSGNLPRDDNVIVSNAPHMYRYRWSADYVFIMVEQLLEWVMKCDFHEIYLSKLS